MPKTLNKKQACIDEKTNCSEDSLSLFLKVLSYLQIADVCRVKTQNRVPDPKNSKITSDKSQKTNNSV